MKTPRYITEETISMLDSAKWEKLCRKLNKNPMTINRTPPFTGACLVIGSDHGLTWMSMLNPYDEMPFDELMEFIREFKAMKFVVDTLEQANKLQQRLFEEGYSWKNGRQITHNTFKFFSTDKTGRIYCYRNNEDFSKAVGKRYITKVTIDFVEADTIEINGVTYIKEEVEQALSNINPA